MKLQTFIKPRTDGTVVLERKNKSDLVFAQADGHEGLVCDVDDEDLVQHLLLTENFGPANEADFDQAEALMEQANTVGSASLDDLDPDEKEPEHVVPEEANTPPVASGKPRSRARR
jgi:hypothetical protein